MSTSDTTLPTHALEQEGPGDGTKSVVVVSGLAGAGKSTAARALEDLGYFVVDNLPPQLIGALVNLADGLDQSRHRLAVVVDAREAAFLDGYADASAALRNSGHQVELLFLDCSDDELVRRFKETRRRHPHGGSEGVRKGIATERTLLDDMQQRADVRIDTTDLSVHDLKRRVIERYSDTGTHATNLTVLSFGFKHGLPTELDLCFDVRFLPNPYFQPELKKKTGLDADVSDFVLEQPGTSIFLGKTQSLLEFLIPQYLAEGKSYVTVAVGCTGGQHRSVALAEELAARLGGQGYAVTARHRDIDKRNT